MGARLHGGGAPLVDVGDHGALGLGYADVGLVGQVGGHGLRRHQAGPLPHQHAHHLRAGQLPDVVGGPHPAVFHKQHRPGLQAVGFQARLDGLEAVGGVGLDGGGGQAVPHHQGHLGALPQGLFDDGLVGLVEAAAPVRPGQVLVLVLAQGLDGDKAVFLHKSGVHVGKHRVLGRRVVGPHPQHGDGFVPGPRPPQAQPGRGAQLEIPEGVAVFRVLHQVLPPEIRLGDVLQAAGRIHIRRQGGGCGRGGFPCPGRLARQLQHHALHQGAQLLFVHIVLTNSIFFAPPQAAGLIHSVVRPLPGEPADAGLRRGHRAGARQEIRVGGALLCVAHDDPARVPAIPAGRRHPPPAR